MVLSVVLLVARGDDGGAGNALAARLAARAVALSPSDPPAAARLALASDSVMAGASSDRAALAVLLAGSNVHRTIRAHAGAVTAVATTQGLIVSAGADGHLRVFVAESGARLYDRKLPVPIASMTATDAAPRMASRDDVGDVSLWNLEDPRNPVRTTLRGGRGSRTGEILLRFVLDGRRLVALDGRGLLEQWDVASGRVLKPVDLSGVLAADSGSSGAKPTIEAAETVALTQDSAWRVVVVDASHAARAVDLPARTVTAIPGFEGLKGRVTAIAAPDEYTLAVATAAGGVLSDIVDDRSWPISRLGIRSLAISEDESLLTGTQDGLGVLDISDNDAIGTEVAPQGYGRSVVALVAGKYAIAAGRSDGTISVVDLQRRALTLPPANGSNGAVFEPGGDLLLTEGSIRAVRGLYSIRPDRNPLAEADYYGQRRVLKPSPEWWDDNADFYINQVAVNHDFIVAGGQDPSGAAAVMVWSARTGKPVARPVLPPGQPVDTAAPLVSRVELVPGEDLLLAYDVTQDALVMWSTKNWRPLAHTIIRAGGGFTVRPGAKVAAVISQSHTDAGSASGAKGDQVVLVGLDDLKVTDTVPMRGVVRIAYSPDGARAAAVAEDGGLQLWSPDFKQRIGRTLRLGNGYPKDLDWRSDGHRIAAVGADGVVIADPDTGVVSPVLPPFPQSTSVGATFGPDGEVLAVTSTSVEDGATSTPETTLWRMGRASMRTGLCRLAGTGLSPEGCA